MSYWRSIIISAIILTSGQVIAQEKYISTSDLNLRSGPGTSYDPIGVIKNGDTVTLLDNSGLTQLEKISMSRKRKALQHG